MADFRLTDHGSIATLVALSQAGRDWIDLHLSEDTVTWCSGVVIEHRYVADIAHGLIDDGLTLEVG